MRTLSFLSVVFAVSISSTAFADIYSSGPAYVGNASGGSVTCRIFNAGLSAASITSRQIFDNTGAAATITSDSCGTALAPTKSCAFSTPFGGNFAYSCRAVSNGADNNLRGVTEIFISPSQFIQVPMSK